MSDKSNLNKDEPDFESNGKKAKPKLKPLPPHVMDSIRRGLEQADNGQTISLEEFKERHLNRK